MGKSTAKRQAVTGITNVKENALELFILEVEEAAIRMHKLGRWFSITVSPAFNKELFESEMSMAGKGFCIVSSIFTIKGPVSIEVKKQKEKYITREAALING